MSNVFVLIKMCYVHNQWYDISCATLYTKGLLWYIILWYNCAIVGYNKNKRKQNICYTHTHIYIYIYIHIIYIIYMDISLFEEWDENKKKTCGHQLARSSDRSNKTLLYLTVIKPTANLSASDSKVNAGSVRLSVIPTTTFSNTCNIIFLNAYFVFLPDYVP